MTYVDPAGKLLGHLDRLALLQTEETPAPINAEIDLSNRCSLGCEWCHFAYTHVRGPLASKTPKPADTIAGGDLMPVELAERIVGELAAAGVESVTWTGGGEPTLHPDFNRIIEHTATTGLAQGIYTHGGHINQERARLLKQHFTFVYVSLDATNRADYKQHKRVDRFDQVCDAIRTLSSVRGAATIGVGYLITSDNWERAGEAVILARDLGADYVQFRPTILYNQDDPGSLTEDTAWLDEAVPYLEALAYLHPDIVEVDADRFRYYKDWHGHDYPTCWWSGLQTIITPNGKVWGCANKREHADALIGDLSHESFSDVWDRRPLATINGSCRLMCRGHLPNLTVTELFRDRAHAEFV